MSEDSNGAPTPEAPEQYAIGISFGNSNSSIAHLSGEGKIEVIANEEGDRQIPSILSYIDGEEYHGTQAKAQLVRNSKNTLTNFRDYLGKDFKSIDPTPCHASAHPQEHGSTIAFSVRDTDSEASNIVTVGEITTRHIRRLRTSASDYTGKTITSAVVAVPTDSTDEQKDALSKAFGEAQIEVLQFIPEPVAAVLAYDARAEHDAKDKLIVVADLGGNRSDVAIVASRGGMYSVLATAHDYMLGGAQLDQVLVDHFAKEFMKKHKTDPRSDPRSLAKLKLESEAVKKSLSQSASAAFSVESLADGKDFRATINRTRYELLAAKILTNFRRLIEDGVRKAGLEVLDIDEVILSGGTAHTPKIAQNLQLVFPETTTILAPATSTTAINPSELSARGAAVQASLVQEFDKEDIDQSTHPMVTVTPHLHSAIGIQIVSKGDEGAFAVMIAPDSAVPVRRTSLFKAPAGDILVRVCEGEREIKVIKPESKPQANGAKGSDDDDDDSGVDDEEEEDIRERVWKAKKTLAEFALKDLKKGGKIEVMVNVGADMALSITAREAGGKGGVRGSIDAPEAIENGKA